MYCGTNKTALSSQQQISDALVRMMTDTPFSQISVSELCREAGVARQTFYSLFSSKENVVRFALAHACCPAEHADAAACEAHEQDPLSHTCEAYAHYVVSNREFLELLERNDIVYLLYDNIHDSVAQGCCAVVACTPTDRAIAAHYLAGGITGVVRGYVETGCSSTVDELAATLRGLLGGGLFGVS